MSAADAQRVGPRSMTSCRFPKAALHFLPMQSTVKVPVWHGHRKARHGTHSDYRFRICNLAGDSFAWISEIRAAGGSGVLLPRKPFKAFYASSA